MILHHNKEQMAIHGSVQSNTGETSLISYSSISGDATQSDQQFSRLKNFISDAVEPFRTELVEVLYPMFIHLYLQLVANGQKIPAQKFYARHHTLFNEDDSCKVVISALAVTTNINELNQNEEISSFKKNKYSITVSENALEYLLHHLKCEDNALLLQIFNLHMQLNVKDVSSKKHARLRNGESTTLFGSLPQSTSASCSSMQDVSLSSLNQSIAAVRAGPLPLPSICLYTCHNSFDSLTTACISSTASHLACGYGNSVMRLWNLTSSKLKVESSSPDASKITLGCDIVNEEEHSERLSSEMVVLRGHSGPVYKVQFSHTSEFIMSASADRTVRLWSMKTCTNLAVYRGHNYPIWALDVGPLSLYFSTGSKDSTARLWTIDRIYPLRIYAGHGGDVDSVKFHPNSNYIATGSSDKTVRLWNVQDAKLARVFRGHQGSVFALAFSPDGKYLASAGEDRRIRLWDIAGGTLYKELKGHTDAVYSLCFNDSGTSIASGGMDNVVRIWDVRKTTLSNTSADGIASPELIGSFPSKSSNILHLHYAKYNLLSAVAACS